MIFLTTIKSITCRTSLKHFYPVLLQKKFIKRTFSIHNIVRIDFNKVNVSRNIHEDKDLESVYNESEDSISELEEYSEMYQNQDLPNPVRTVLFPTPIDYLMTKINSAASVQEVFDLIKNNESYLRHEHIAQSVLVLWDLQKMFYHVNLMNNTLTNQSNIITDLADKYFKQLNEHPDFKLLLNKIEQNCDKYNNDTLAVILLYLNRIGMDVKTNLSQLLIKKFNDKNSEVSISALSRFTTIFRNNDLSSYYYTKDYITTILNYIENSSTVEEFKQCTICLNNIRRIISDDAMFRYTQVLRRHLKSGFLDGCEPKAVLAIIMFLNYPEWRDSNTQLITDTILLVKDKIHLLNSYELLLFYEVFYKIQEPALILNELQRHASRYLALFEEEAVPLLDVRLRLMFSLVVNSSYSQRSHYQRILKQHSSYDLNRNSIFQYYKLLSYTKVSDADVSKKLWQTMLNLLNTDIEFRTNNLHRVCMNYLHYMLNVNGHRSYALEKRINTLLEKEILDGYLMIFYPAKVSCVATYLIVYGQSKKILDVIINHLEKYKDRLNHIDCLNYTKALNLAKETKYSVLTNDYINRIQNVINYGVMNNISDDMDINTNNLLLKCCIYNSDLSKTNSELVTKLINKCADNSVFSTRIVKNLAFCMSSTHSLVPQVVDDMVDYIIKAKDNVLGFNVEKVLSLCYQLGYQPQRAQEFFQVTTEVILRDQERFTGISYLQSCLALCYFQSLPTSFIKQIFNTVFLDKLDNELANCYRKDSYPMRVRHLLMQLNRAVCIDYPEANVPWFHQKYIHELLRKANLYQDGMTQKLIKSYLIKILPGYEYLQQNIITPYGYYIHFALNLDEENQFIKSIDITDRTPFKKIALLLLKSNDFTNVKRQLMGKSLLKVRHLEILGYNVVLLDVPVWENIVSGFEKVAYLRTLINVPNSEISDTTSL